MVSFFVLDIFITFNKGYYHEGKGIFIDNYIKIFKRYAHFQFWIDLICVVFMITTHLTTPEKG